MLSDPSLHEKLTSAVWSKDIAKKIIGEIVERANNSFDDKNLWPVHPDLAECYKFTKPVAGLWYGAVGGIAALTRLCQVDPNLPSYDFSKSLSTLWPHQQENLAELDKMLPVDTKSPGYLLGESSINLLRYKLTKDKSLLALLSENIKDNINNPANEFMWAASGTMLVAWFLYQDTKDEDWIDLFRQSANAVFDAWEYDQESNCHLWTSTMYGTQTKHLGFIHGPSGNGFTMMKGYDWLSETQQTQLVERMIQTFVNTAIVSDKHANWLFCTGEIPKAMDKPCLQLCLGAPGVVLGLAEYWPYMDKQAKTVYRKAMDLIWDAGPLVKPWGLCHGTAGNGWCFLKMAHLTGEQQWLDRAKQFAMHAIRQYEAMYEKYQQIRPDFLCGDLGLAMYLQACMNETHEFLALDYFC